MDFDYRALRRPRIRMICRHGIIEGTLGKGSLPRTLDELNVPSREFVVIHSPEISSSAWSIEGTPLAVNKSSILFVVELAENPHGSDGRAEVSQYRRVPVRAYVADYAVEGFIHIPRGGDPMKKLNQKDTAFVAVTSASIVGSQLQLSVPFVAVNLSQVNVAHVELQEQDKSDPVPAKERIRTHSP